MRLLDMGWLKPTRCKRRIGYIFIISYPTCAHRIIILLNVWGEQGWRSGESARLPLMWPGFKSWTQHHMWVEFVVGSHPCSKGFSPGSLVFLPPQEPTLLNSNSIWDPRASGLSVARLLSVTLIKQSRFFIYLFTVNPWISTRALISNLG